VAGYWINDSLIHMILIGQTSDPYSPGSYVATIYDPFEGLWADDLLDKMGRTDHLSFGVSPDETRAIYFTRLDATPLALDDLDKNTTLSLWSSSGYSFVTASYPGISWAPDSSFAAMTYMPTVRLLSRDGESYKTIADSTSILGNVVATAWSPDSRYLAFVTAWNTTPLTSSHELYIYDVVRGKYLYRCPLASYSRLAPDLIWSPDGAHIALAAQLAHQPLQVLNVQTGKVIELVHEARAVGWSAVFPFKWP
jgi:WD40 repeat protein